MTLLIHPVVALKSFSIFITFFLLADRIASVFGGAHLVPAASKSPLNLLLMVKIVTHDVNFSNHCTGYNSNSVTRALFIFPEKVIFHVRLQIFFHAGCNTVPPKELPPHAKNDECG
jgi:hypothetical protein